MWKIGGEPNYPVDSAAKTWPTSLVVDTKGLPHFRQQTVQSISLFLHSFAAENLFTPQRGAILEGAAGRGHFGQAASLSGGSMPELHWCCR
jgi:hypothetical protein